MSIRECVADIGEIVHYSFDSFLDRSRLVGKLRLLNTKDLDNSELDPGCWETSMYFLIHFMCLHRVATLLKEKQSVWSLVRRVHDLLVEATH